jgi:rubredoxin
MVDSYICEKCGYLWDFAGAVAPGVHSPTPKSRPKDDPRGCGAADNYIGAAVMEPYCPVCLVGVLGFRKVDGK